MDLSLTEQQQLLKHGVEDFVAREAPKETVIELGESELGYSPELFARVAELGSSDQDSKQRSRERYSLYRDQGHEINTHKL